MSFRRYLIASLGLNTVLAIALTWTLFNRPEKMATASASASTTPAPVSHEKTAEGARSTQAIGPADAEWPRWIAQLHAAGVSGRAIASMVLADFDRRWDRQQEELQHRYEQGEIDSAALALAQAGRDREREAELRDALGETEFRAWQKEELLRPFVSAKLPLSDEESERLYAMNRDVTEKRRDLEEAHARGEIDGASLDEKTMALDTDYDNALKSVLGPERYAKMRGEDDGVETDLRRQLHGFNLPPAQVAALADVERARSILQEDLEARMANKSVPAASMDARRLAIEAARDQAYERILGPNEFAAWQKANDARYQTLQRFANTWQLNDADVAVVYGAIREQERLARERRLQALSSERFGKPVDWDAVEAQVGGLAQQTEQNLIGQLGAERVDRLKQNGVLPRP